MWRLIGGLALVLAAVPGVAQGTAQEDAKSDDPPRPERRRSLGVQVEVGAFLPVDSEVRDRFGDVLYRIGVRPEGGRRAGNWRGTFDLSAISAERDGNRMFILPVSLAFVRSFGDPKSQEYGYVQLGAGPAYMDYAINRLSQDQLSRVRVASKKIGVGAHVEAGYSFGERLLVTARYDWLSETDDIEFGGVSFSAAYTLFRF